MFVNLNIYVVIRKYKPTFLLLPYSKNFSNKKIRADTPHTRYQPLELSYKKIVTYLVIIQFMHFYIPSSQLLDSEIYRHIAFHVYKLALLFSWLPRRHSLHHTHSLFVEHSMA